MFLPPCPVTARPRTAAAVNVRSSSPRDMKCSPFWCHLSLHVLSNHLLPIRSFSKHWWPTTACFSLAFLTDLLDVFYSGQWTRNEAFLLYIRHGRELLTQTESVNDCNKTAETHQSAVCMVSIKKHDWLTLRRREWTLGLKCVIYSFVCK